MPGCDTSRFGWSAHGLESILPYRIELPTVARVETQCLISMSNCLANPGESALSRFARALVDQDAARIIVPPNKCQSGFWFGGGNMIEDQDGRLYVIGRYRNHGDSRTGLNLGERGLELAIFRSEDRGTTFEKFVAWTKPELNIDEREVLSIEGSALHWTDGGVELFVSTEKSNIAYPTGLDSFQKPGTGVWTIDHLQAATIEELKDAQARTVVQSSDPRFTHVKDPFVYDDNQGLVLLFCTHPFNWSSSNTAYCLRKSGEEQFGEIDFDFFPRGFTWDVAITRGTCVVDVPRVGPFAERDLRLVFYDGGESLRNIDQHAAAVTRPRGYSCEEIGGVACVANGNLESITRLSTALPWFISPHGTGCSRYVDVHVSSDGYYVTWQQSRNNLSQPLVMNFLSHDRARELLT